MKNKPQDEETAIKTSQLLQVNHDKHHIYFNQSGFHNHIAHHLLTLYGLGASAPIIQKQYDINASYQRPAVPVKAREVQNISNPSDFAKYLGKEKYYHDFLIFFQNEMEAKGWQAVVNEYVFAGDERADDMLGRMYAGLLHPLIHLGFGIEFNQPAIIAEALAQAAIHDAWTSGFLLSTEKAASSRPAPTSKSMFQLLDDIRADTKLSTAARWGDGSKIRNGVVGRAQEEITSHALSWLPTSQTLEAKTLEMVNATIYFTACAQHPPKQVKFDFNYIHCLNCSIFFPTFNAQSWLSMENKVRMLKFKGWLDLTTYASQRSPELLLGEVATYVPKMLEAGDAEWPGIFRRLCESDDDGHAAKLGRAVRNGELMSERWVNEGGNEDMLRIKGFMWEKIGNMVIDSTEDSGATWVRGAGFDEAWKQYEDRPRQVHL